jgi:cytochrome c-type biogenesis protein CcmH
MAMAPSLKLSSFKQVAVIARISMSGGATAQSGDLQGLSAALDLDKTDSVAITIDQRIP